MSKQTYYEQLGVAETASFEEIQAARTKLSQDCADDPQRLQTIEKAYDALLMDRLRLRQEGKIQVPDGVRFAENKTAAKPVSKLPRLPQWSQSGNIISGTPELWDWLAPTLTYTVLAGLAIGFPGRSGEGLQTWMAIGTGAALFFVYRKERRVLRAILFSFGGLVLGFVAGMPLAKAVLPQISLLSSSPSLAAGILVSWLTFGLLWGISCFLR
jgi:hypothetical protein